MKTVVIIECRNCTTKIIGEDVEITLLPKEEVEIIIRTVSKCSICKAQLDRSVYKQNVKFSN